MIPYYPQPVLHLGPLQIHAFGFLAALAVVLGGRVVLLRAHRKGIPAEQMFQFCCWTYLIAMVCAVLSKLMLDNFPAFFVDPVGAFRTNLGFRSFGGIAGGFAGGLLWCRWRRLSFFETMRRFDIVAYATPFAWMIGRLGCTLAHDHRGLWTTSWIAVKFPEGSRYDLGLVEFLFLIAMTIAFRLLDRKPRPVGFYFGLYGVVYGGFRIWLDTLHAQPLRFYGGAVGVLVGLLGWAWMFAYERSHAPEATASPATV
ncbi:MAG TPA: prolipoprotein diacylglyceryl transferase family protein [Bryobacteraceae bacterium]|nr:prolipoprotein diacylglyceryl transferase family protein [Bryobacteraceae bacterium]